MESIIFSHPSVPQWEYDEDSGSVMCRCPYCAGRLVIGHYQYINHYRYCPYCGEGLSEGNITAKRMRVYGTTLELEERSRGGQH